MIEEYEPHLRPIHRILELVEFGHLEAASKILHEALNLCEDDWEQAIKDFGFRYLGAGAYSIVFQIPGRIDVVKVNYNSYDVWWKYVDFVKQTSQNPMVPRIWDYHSHEGMMICRMELLQPLPYDTWVEGMVTTVKAVKSDIKVGGLTKRGLRDRIIKTLKTNLSFTGSVVYSPSMLAPIVKWMADVVDGNTVLVDCHAKNWMMRGNQIVLTDPISEG